jgi:hypothetical protein
MEWEAYFVWLDLVIFFAGLITPMDEASPNAAIGRPHLRACV